MIELAFELSFYAFLDRVPGEEPLKNVPLLLQGIPLRYWFSWSVGAYLAELYLRGDRWPLAGFRPFGVLLLAAVGAEMIRYVQVFSFTLFALAAAAGIATLLANETPVWQRSRFLSTRLTTTGRWSYSIYLLHMPLVVWVALALPARLPTGWNRPWILFGLTLASWLLIMPLSGLWYHFFEVPGIALGKKVARALESGRNGTAVDEKGKRDHSGV